MEFNVYVTPEEFEAIKNLDSRLGYLIWNIADMIAPYDTGNLRSAITLAKNSSTQIKLKYDLMTANYIKFLEEGLGRVKKYKGFIKNDTVGAIIEALIAYIASGGKNLSTSISKPTIYKKLGTPFSQENKILNTMNRFDRKVITFDQRRKISQIRETQFRKISGQKMTRQVGERAETQSLINDRFYKKYNRGNVSQLSKIMSETRKLR